MTPFTTKDFFGFLRLIAESSKQVIAQGQDIKCKRLQTFAVVFSRDQVADETLGKDARYIGTDYFYSRLWKDNGSKPSSLKYEYPLLGIMEDTDTITNAFDNGRRFSTRFTIFVLDKMPDKLNSDATKTICGSRTWEEVGENCKLLMMKTFDSLAAKDWDGVPLDAFFDGNVSGEKIFRAFKDDLAGYFCKINVTLDSCQETFETNEATPIPVSPDDACCP